MSTVTNLDSHLENLSTDVDAWTRGFFERVKPSSDRFARLIGYPLGWVDADLRPLDRPAATGKRLRSALCLLCCEAVAGDYRAALAPAAAIELIHNFSLVHDDIQDESLVRRGRPTVWAQWRTPQAINVGDSLFALAQLALFQDESSPPALLVEAARELNATCLQLVEGQFLDLELQATRAASLEAYQTMVQGKTAALLECAAWLGARFGRAEVEHAQRFAAFGRQLGVAFQLQDDMLGMWGDPEHTGKSADADLRTRKPALPAVLALESSGPAAGQFRRLFAAPKDLTPDQTRAARRMLEALDVPRRVHEMVEAAYAGAQQKIAAALDGNHDSPLCGLIQLLKGRRA
jgi:geranylgeranyl diphosphate synthase, type I